MNLDMESQIHYLETEAYFSVLRAFKAQSDAITWDKEGLITNLRKELGVSDDEHREVLGRVNTDESIRRIREWRQAGGNLAIHDELQSPNFRKKQRTSHTVPALTIPPAVLHPHSITTDVQPSPSFRSQVRKSNQTNGKNQYGTPGTFVGHEAPAGGQELVGRKAFTRWPDDNKFYEAVITQYNPQDGRHHLVYDMGTPRETWEWVDLRQIPREDIRWVGDDPGLSYRFGDRRSTGPGGGAIPPPTRSRHRRDFQNGSSRTDIDDIEILHTETLIKEVEKVVVASNPDRFEIEKAKKMLKDHEQALEYAISRLTYVSDGESDGGQ